MLLLFGGVQLGPCKRGRAGQRRGQEGGWEEQRSKGLTDGEVGLECVGTGLAHSSTPALSFLGTGIVTFLPVPQF